MSSIPPTPSLSSAEARESIEQGKDWQDDGPKYSDFQIIDLIGEGQFGKIFLAQHKASNLMVALKSIRHADIKGQNHLFQHLHVEIFLHSRLKHPNILRMFGHFMHGDSMYMVLQYACEGSLHEKLMNQKYRRFTDQTIVAQCIYQTASALKEIHRHGFFHGDIKPENILFDLRGTVKVADFGLAWPLSSSEYCQQMLFTLEYAAPEVLSGDKCDNHIDIWSLGVLCYELLIGRTPFCSPNDKKTRKHILEVRYQIHRSFQLEKGAEDLISKLLQKEPSYRLQLDDVMAHYWIKKHYPVSL